MSSDKREARFSSPDFSVEANVLEAVDGDYFLGAPFIFMKWARSFKPSFMRHSAGFPDNETPESKAV